jgi:hypothetical protein
VEHRDRIWEDRRMRLHAPQGWGFVRARGEIGDSSYTNDKGATVYATDRNVDRFSFLRAAKDEPRDLASVQDDVPGEDPWTSGVE